jgi:hypothetical protein
MIFAWAALVAQIRQQLWLLALHWLFIVPTTWAQGGTGTWTMEGGRVCALH